MVLTFTISLLLLAVSGLALDTHRNTWRRAQQDGSLSERDLRFERAKYRRRMQASGIIGALGLAIGAWPLVDREPWPFLLYTAGLALGLACIVVLAALDMWATRRHFARLRNDLLAAQAKLVKDLRRDDR